MTARGSGLSQMRRSTLSCPNSFYGWNAPQTYRQLRFYLAFYLIIYFEILTMENELLQRITINPEVCHGKPTIRNKRYPVENILELMASGMTNEEILADYEDLENEDLQACLLFAENLENAGTE